MSSLSGARWTYQFEYPRVRLLSAGNGLTVSALWHPPAAVAGFSEVVKAISSQRFGALGMAAQKFQSAMTNVSLSAARERFCAPLVASIPR